MAIEKWYLTFGLISYDEKGAGMIVHEELKLQANCKDEAIEEASKIKAGYAARAVAEKDGQKRHPKHGKMRYIDKLPVEPMVVCKIALV